MKRKLFHLGLISKNIRRLIFLFFILISLNSNINAQVAVVVKFYIQGYYIGNNLMAPVLYEQCIGSGLSPAACLGTYPITDVDTVKIELHDKNNYSLVPGGTYFERVQTDGTIACTFSVPADMYYIVVKYKNSIQTWSNVPVALSSTSVTYDFTLLANKAYGSNQTTEFYIHSDSYGNPDPPGGVGGKSCSIATDGTFKFYSGDISDPFSGIGFQDGISESQDFIDMENSVFEMLGGFFPVDLNGDGGIDLLDMLIVERSVYNTYVMSTP